MCKGKCITYDYLCVELNPGDHGSLLWFARGGGTGRGQGGIRVGKVGRRVVQGFKLTIWQASFKQEIAVNGLPPFLPQLPAVFI